MIFEELKAKIEAADQKTRREGIDAFYLHYLSLSNDALRRIASREMFQQLRPMFSVEDVLGRAMQKIRARLEDGRLKLRTEKRFLSYVTYTIRMIVLDLNRRQKLAIADAGSDEILANQSDHQKGVSTVLMAQEAKALLLSLLEELLTTEELYLIRRHYFEGATYKEIADEVLRPPLEPLTPEVQKNRNATISMRITRVREKLNKHDEELLPLLV
jgi:RNA polymerase sigma factor (sigma-70 family)